MPRLRRLLAGLGALLMATAPAVAKPPDPRLSAYIHARDQGVQHHHLGRGSRHGQFGSQLQHQHGHERHGFGRFDHGRHHGHQAGVLGAAPFHHHEHHHVHHRGHGRLGWGGWPDTFGGHFAYPYGGFGYLGWPSPHGIYYNPRTNQLEYFLPPIHAPAELQYGPQAVMRFFGWDRDLGSDPLLRPAQRHLLNRAAEVRPPIRQSNLEARQRSARFLQFGDELFRQQRFHEALQRYKLAAEAAPDVAEAYFRQGHALVASNRFDLAARAFKRALALNPDPARDGFHLDQLYGDNQLAKASHLEALADSALQRSDDADLFFLLGVLLYYDGQAERAQKFLHRAMELAGNDHAHLRSLLNQQHARVP